MEQEKLEALAKAFTQQSLPESEVELSGEIPYELVEPLEGRALAHLQEELELPGFRKGHVPPDMVRKRVGDAALLEEAVELFMRDFYPALVQTRDIDAVGRPQIRITKLAPGNPVGISVRTTIYPDVVLPKDWRTLSKDIPEEPAPAVEDKEIDEALEAIRKAQAKANDPSATPQSEVTPENLPPIDDAFAQSLGNFTDLADLKSKMRQNLEQEKAQKARDTRRGKIIEKLLEKSTLAVPAIFVESELDKIMAQMRDDISRYGLAFEDYLKRINKTEDDIRTEFREQAKNRAKLQLVLNKIAEEEKVEADKDAVEKELGHAIEHFPDARPELVRIHIETVLRNEKVLQLLEGLTSEAKK
jgi:FKBP-type peptidyl-prolyl cis-trans isomerase (trigger factor)